MQKLWLLYQITGYLDIENQLIGVEIYKVNPEYCVPKETIVYISTECLKPRWMLTQMQESTLPQI